MKRSTREINFFVILFVFMGAIVFSGCDKDDDTEPQNNQIEQIIILPQSASIAAGEQLEFSTAGITAAGDTVATAGLGLEWDWWSSDPDVFTVDDSGTATAQNPGEAFCILDFTESAGHLKFTGRDSAFVFVF